MKPSRLVAFAVVGAVGFVVDAGVLQLLTSLFGLEVHAGRVLSFLAASATTWRLNRRFTFGAEAKAATTAASQFVEWIRYLWSSAAGAVFNYGAFSAVVALGGNRGIYPVLGVAVGSVAGMLVNFTLYSRYVFRQRAYH